jgi:hypothetical protein
MQTIQSQATQVATVAAVFATGAKLSSRDALLTFGITRLAARVFDLQVQGWSIERTTARDLAGRRFVRYSAASRPVTSADVAAFGPAVLRTVTRIGITSA